MAARPRLRSVQSSPLATAGGWTAADDGVQRRTPKDCMLESRILDAARVARRQLQWRRPRGRCVKVSADKSTEVRAHRVRTHHRPYALPCCAKPPISVLTAPSSGHRWLSSAFSRLGDRLCWCCFAMFVALRASAAMDAIMIMLEDRALPSAASERVFCMLSCVGSLVSPPGPLPQSVPTVKAPAAKKGSSPRQPVRNIYRYASPTVIKLCARPNQTWYHTSIIPLWPN